MEAHHAGLTASNALDLVSAYDVVVDCSDNAPTRYLASDACVVAGRPLVSGAAIGTDGQLTVYCHGEQGGPAGLAGCWLPCTGVARCAACRRLPPALAGCLSASWPPSPAFVPCQACMYGACASLSHSGVVCAPCITPDLKQAMTPVLGTLLSSRMASVVFSVPAASAVSEAGCPGRARLRLLCPAGP